MRKINVILFAALLSACNGAAVEKGASTGARTEPQKAKPAASHEVSYGSIARTAFAAKRPVGLCELVQILDGGGGIYRVKSMKGVTETTPSGAPDGFTYIELDRIDAWTADAPEHPVARIPGGPAGNGVTRGFGMDLAVGEVLGVMFYAPRAENADRHGIDSLGLFQKDKRGGYTNGQLFLDKARGLDEIGHLVHDNALAGKACPHEVQPFEGLPSPAVAQPSAPVPAHKVILGKGDAPSE